MTGNRRELGGSFALGPWHVRRAGYGAMQLAGDGGFGPPRDRYEALRVAVAPGVDHIDTAQYYGAVNELIHEELFPYPDGLAIVSKVAARRDPVARRCGSKVLMVLTVDTAFLTSSMRSIERAPSSCGAGSR